MSEHSSLASSLLFVLMVSCHHVRGDYTLRVLFSGYSNPDNTCYQCTSGGVQGCCDSRDQTDCTGGRRCDNEFFYCLMPSGSSPATTAVSSASEDFNTRAGQLGCLPQSAQWSQVDTNAQAMSTTVLGLPNPLVFEVTAPRWQVRTRHVILGSLNEQFLLHRASQCMWMFWMTTTIVMT